ncbi:F-box/kelch-repeat protein At3g06240-like [Rhododendron vialii]|uniref:F-box/kelch-repeat protein At3g06240-like n=1 Tax=Rhododendron vialii TaxID=182163 RepID=UPI00265FA77E|nr:F-box/kelch-repeat protein At3g06240-like [Rhododendron vialii]
MSSGGTLPQDIIKDIVSRLPVKSLHRFKCTSPSWKSQISDSQFAKTNHNRTKIKNSKYAEQKIIIISGCGNLYSMDPNDVNPTSTKLEFPTMEQHDTKKWVQVLSSCEEGVIDDFAIVAVYSLKTNAWRRVEDFQSRCVEGNSGGVFLNGCLHYLCCDARHFSKRIIAFDLSDEVFREVPRLACLDGSTNHAHAYYRLEILGDCLYLNFDTYGIRLRKRKKEGFRHIPMFVVRRAVY